MRSLVGILLLLIANTAMADQTNQTSQNTQSSTDDTNVIYVPVDQQATVPAGRAAAAGYKAGNNNNAINRRNPGNPHRGVGRGAGPMHR